MNDEKGNKKGKKNLVAGGVAMLVTAFAGVVIPTELLLEIWNAMPWS